MTKLKDCPFCGGDKLRFGKDKVDQMIGSEGSVICTNCSAKAPLQYWAFLGDDKDEIDTLTEQNKQLVENFQVLIHEMKQELVRGSYAVDTESGSSMVISIPAVNSEISKITRALIDDDYMNSILAKHKEQI